jgi:hypothetical protein
MANATSHVTAASVLPAEGGAGLAAGAALLPSRLQFDLCRTLSLLARAQLQLCCFAAAAATAARALALLAAAGVAPTAPIATGFHIVAARAAQGKGQREHEGVVEVQLREALRSLRIDLGHDHPKTVAVMVHLASALLESSGAAFPGRTGHGSGAGAASASGVPEQAGLSHSRSLDLLQPHSPSTVSLAAVGTAGVTMTKRAQRQNPHRSELCLCQCGS